MRICVTGGGGFLGGHFVRSALARGYEVVDVDVRTYAADPDRHATARGYRWILADVRRVHPRHIEAVAEGPIDALVHLAAESHVDNSLEGPEEAVSVNTLGTAHMLEVARILRVPRVLIMSTDEVTGEVLEGSTNESSPIRPSSPYSAGKAAGEFFAQAWARSYGIPICVVRCTNLYGPYQHPEKFLPRAITYALARRPIPVFGDGRQVRDWIWVEDAAAGLWAVLERGVTGEVYALGSRQASRTNGEIAQEIATRLAGAVEAAADRPGHDRRYATDPTKAEGLGWKAAVPFADGLTQTIEWYCQQTPWWRAAIARGGRW